MPPVALSKCLILFLGNYLYRTGRDRNRFWEALVDLGHNELVARVWDLLANAQPQLAEQTWDFKVYTGKSSGTG